MGSRNQRSLESKQFSRTILSSYGVNICLQTELKDGLGTFERFLPFGCKRSTAKKPDRTYSIVKDASGKYKLYADGRNVDESREIEDIFLRFQSHSQLFIAAHTRHRSFVHAGVVAVGDRAILIPGRSYAGKTTLVAEFIKAGAVYYSDEYAVLDRLGRVHPYSKPLSLRNKTTGKQRDVSAESLGGRTGFDPLPVGIILVTKYKNGARWRAKESGSADGLKALIMNSVSIRQTPEPTLRSIARAASGALVLKGDRGNAHRVVKDVMSNVHGWLEP